MRPKRIKAEVVGGIGSHEEVKNFPNQKVILMR